MLGSGVRAHLGVNNTVSIPDSNLRQLIASCHGEFQVIKEGVKGEKRLPITSKSLSCMSGKYGEECGCDRHRQTVREREKWV